MIGVEHRAAELLLARYFTRTDDRVRGVVVEVLISTSVGHLCVNDGETPLRIHASMSVGKTRLPAYVHVCISPLSQPLYFWSYMYVHIRSHSHTATACARRSAVSREPRNGTTSCIIFRRHSTQSFQPKNTASSVDSRLARSGLRPS